MHHRTHVARLVALAVAASSAAIVGPAGPAHATTVHATVVSLDPLQLPAIEHGSSTVLTGAVRTSGGGAVPEGVATLWALPHGATNWVQVGVDAGKPTYLSFSVTPSVSTAYVVRYSGYTAASESQDTYLASDGSPVTVSVKRQVSVKYRSQRLYGQVSPKLGKKKLVFKRQQGKKYVLWFKVRANKKGKFSRYVGRASGTDFKLIVKAKGGFVRSVDRHRII